jgi:DNA topoisomerase IB
VVQEVAAYLGNTPAVARASYIDPGVISRYQEGRTIAAALGELGKDAVHPPTRRVRAAGFRRPGVGRGESP